MYKVYFGNNNSWTYLKTIEDYKKFIDSRFNKEPPYMRELVMSENEIRIDYGSHRNFL